MEERHSPPFSLPSLVACKIEIPKESSFLPMDHKIFVLIYSNLSLQELRSVVL